MLNAQIRTSFMFLQVALINIAAVKITFGRMKVFIFVYINRNAQSAVLYILYICCIMYITFSSFDVTE